MSATTWLIIAIIGFSLAGIALIIAVFMFIKMNIAVVIGDLSGKTVAREIKAMREFNKSKGDRSFRPSKINLERGTLTEKVENSQDNRDVIGVAHASKRLDKPTSNDHRSSGTIGLNDFETDSTDILDIGNNPTEMLVDNATGVLIDRKAENGQQNATEVLFFDETEVLSSNTTVLNGTTVLKCNEKLNDEDVKSVRFKVTKSSIITHTDEVI